MGNTYEVWSLEYRPERGLDYYQVHSSQSIIKAIKAMRAARKAGAGCIKLEWRPSDG